MKLTVGSNFPFSCGRNSLCKVEGKGTYSCRKNDPKLNKHHPFVIQLWRSNMDIQPVVSLQDVVNYIVKYAAKGEVQSRTYGEIVQHILQTEVSNSDTVKKAIQKIDNEICGRRNLFSAGMFSPSYELFVVPC